MGLLIEVMGKLRVGLILVKKDIENENCIKWKCYKNVFMIDELFV